jgi:hypothetical protein
MFFGTCFMYGLGCSSSSTGAPPGDGGTVSTGAGGGGPTGPTTTGSTTTGTGGAGGSGTSSLGAPCTSDAQCGGGLTCIKTSDNLSNLSPGGVPNGMCTRDCTNDQMACGPLGGICVGIDGSADAGVSKAACFETCAIGTGTKCHARQDMACEPVNRDETIFSCIPICVTDSDCGTRKCDVGSGLCVETVTPGKPVGSGCTASRMSNNECAGGLCLPIQAVPDGGTTPGICTALCRLGTQEACGYRINAVDAGPPMGACIYPWGDPNVYATGDLGLCLQLCDTEGDCSYHAADWTCRTDFNIRGFAHHPCLPPPPD